jgi:hypothetical protein
VWRRPVGLVRATDHTGAGAATGAPLAGGVARCRCSSRMCQSRSLLVLNSRPRVTHFTGIGGFSRSTGRLAGCTPPRRRRPHSSRIDQLGACSKGGGWWVRRAGQTGSDRSPCWLSGVRFHQGRLIVCGPAIRRGAARLFHGQGAEKSETRDWTPIEVEARSACIEPDEWASLPTVLGQRDAARLRRR